MSRNLCSICGTEAPPTRPVLAAKLNHPRCHLRRSALVASGATDDVVLDTHILRLWWARTALAAIELEILHTDRKAATL